MEKKTLIIIGSSILGFFIVIILIIWLISAFKPHYVGYEQLEAKIKIATEKYYNDHIETMPSENGQYRIDYNTLVSNEYIKPLSEMLKDGNNCTANTVIIKNDSDISYIPYVMCGEKYETKELYKKVLEDNPVVQSEKGLYQAETGEYYFKGKVENNYVSFGSRVKNKNEVPLLWRIMSINGETITLKSQLAFEDKTKWDDRYNISKERSVGYNDFETSVIKDYLTKMNDDTIFLSNDSKIKMNLQNICIGQRSKDDTTKNGTVECAVKSKDQYYYRTMYPYEYLRSSLDPNCVATNSISCSNLNYLAEMGISIEWLLTKSDISDYQSYSYNAGTITLSATNTERKVYPVIELNRYSFFKSGIGTKEDPYIVR